MNIRKATTTDLKAIMTMIKAVVPLMIASGNNQWDDTYPNEAVFAQDVMLGQLWIAEMDGAIAGVAAITTDQDPEYAQVGWDINEKAIVVHRLAVNPEFQGKGVAVSLLQQAEEVAAQNQIKCLRIDTNSMNKATQKLFPKLGYVFAGEITLNFRPGQVFYGYQKHIA